MAETLRDMRGKAAQEVQFAAVRRFLPSASVDGTTIAGSGRYGARVGAARPFTYSCTYAAQTGKASGVVLKETGTAAPVAERPWEPDLTHLSPDACEAAAAAALKEKYPPVGRITFSSDSRQLRPAPNARTSLEGQGQLERAAGMNPAPFTYHCVVETKSGKLVSMHTDD